MTEPMARKNRNQGRDDLLDARTAGDRREAAKYGRRLAEREVGIGVLLDEFFARRTAIQGNPEAVAQLDESCKAALEAYVERRLQQVTDEAECDSVTGLPGRAAFEKALAEEMARAGRYDRVFSLALLDLDGLKSINDRFGHQTGDRLLREAGRALRHSLRESDRIFRYGGDEFAVLSPETRAEDLALALGRVEAELHGSVGFSWGVAGFPEEADTAEILVGTADRRLYECKRRRG